MNEKLDRFLAPVHFMVICALWWLVFLLVFGKLSLASWSGFMGLNIFLIAFGELIRYWFPRDLERKLQKTKTAMNSFREESEKQLEKDWKYLRLKKKLQKLELAKFKIENRKPTALDWDCVGFYRKLWLRIRRAKPNT